MEEKGEAIGGEGECGGKGSGQAGDESVGGRGWLLGRCARARTHTHREREREREKVAGTGKRLIFWLTLDPIFFLFRP